MQQYSSCDRTLCVEIKSLCFYILTFQFDALQQIDANCFEIGTYFNALSRSLLLICSLQRGQVRGSLGGTLAETGNI